MLQMLHLADKEIRTDLKQISLYLNCFSVSVSNDFPNETRNSRNLWILMPNKKAFHMLSAVVPTT